MTADSALVFGFCLLLIVFLVFYLLEIRRAIRSRRLRELERLFDAGIADIRRSQLKPALTMALQSLQQADEIVRRGRQRISSLAPVVPPPVVGVVEASELQARMVECLEQDYKGWKIGGDEELLVGLVDAGGHRLPELLQQTVASSRNPMGERPGELAAIAKHVFGKVADSKENSGVVVDPGQRVLDPHDVGRASVDGTGTGGGAVRGGRFRSVPILGPLIQRGSYRKAQRAYEAATVRLKAAEDESMRKTYERYREVALDQTVVFKNQVRDIPLPSESSAIQEVAAGIGRAAQEDYQSECQAVRDAAETAAADGGDKWYYRVIGLGMWSEAERLLADKVDKEIGAVDARYRPLIQAGDLSTSYMERVGRATALDRGALARTVERAATRIEVLLRQDLEEFVVWSSGAKVAHEQSLKRLIEVVGSESDRHAKEMDAWAGRLHALREEVEREAGMAGA